MNEPLLLLPFSLEQLKAAMTDVIRAEIQKINTPANEEFLSTKEVCAILKISDVTLGAYCAENILVPYKVKGRNFYTRSMVEKAIVTHGLPKRKKQIHSSSQSK